ncbi:MAG TPA: type II toxin-antitoxin system PrlF family antitoxin [Dehalococcoidia bacterium]|nr:type II toxin-antitoxin system PrlF family antitoxin [Dehalococcoidia bacterium]
MREIWASVTERGQVTIPSEVRKLLGLNKRDKVVFALEDGHVMLKRPRFATIADVAGSVPALDPPRDWKQVEQDAKDEVVERYIRKMREGDA